MMIKTRMDVIDAKEIAWSKGIRNSVLTELQKRIDKLECPHPDLIHFVGGHDQMHGQVSNVIEEMIKEVV